MKYKMKAKLYIKTIILIHLLLILYVLYNPAFSQGIIAEYRFNSEALDYSGNGNHGAIVGNVIPVNDRFNNPCSALQFDGTSGFIEIPSSPSLESPANQITITAWYKLSRNFKNNYWLTVLCKGQTNYESLDNPQYRLQVQQNFNLQPNTCSPTIPNLSSTISLTTDFTICDKSFDRHMFEADQWHFYSITYDGLFVKTYMDGVLIFEQPYSREFGKNSYPLYIGKDEPGVTEYFEGVLDDIVIYNTALSDKDIYKLFAENKTVPYTEDYQLYIPENIFEEAKKGQCGNVLSYPIPEIKSPCIEHNVVLKEGLKPGSFFPVGKTRIRYDIEASDGSRHSYSWNAVVTDKEPPVIYVPRDTIIDITDNKSISVVYKLPTASDNCGIKEIVRIKGPNIGDTLNPGTYACEFLARDIHGLEARGIMNITIRKHPDGFTDKKNESTPTKIDSIKTVLDTSKTLIPNISSKKYDTLSTEFYKSNNLVFLIDISSSMKEDNKVGLLKLALKTLIKQLRGIDQITILTYSDAVKVFVTTTNVLQKDSILSRIESIQPFGGTEGSAGIQLAYEAVINKYLPEANNEIFLFSDGMFETDKKQRKLIQNSAKKNIRFNVFAFGTANSYLQDLRELSDMGTGKYISIKNELDAQEYLLNIIKMNSKK